MTCFKAIILVSFLILLISDSAISCPYLRKIRTEGAESDEDGRQLRLKRSENESKHAKVRPEHSEKDSKHTKAIVNAIEGASKNEPSNKFVSSDIETNSIPGICLKTNGETPAESKANICSAYNSLTEEFETHLPSNDDFSLSDLLGASIRLAFHDAGEVDISSGDLMGSDGCLSNSRDNAGLIEASSPVQTILEPLFQKYCDKISRADVSIPEKCIRTIYLHKFKNSVPD